MSTLKAIVQGGRAIIEDVDYPDGTVLELSLVEEEEEDMTEEERARLHKELALSLEEARSGELLDAQDVISELRS